MPSIPVRNAPVRNDYRARLSAAALTLSRLRPFMPNGDIAMWARQIAIATASRDGAIAAAHRIAAHIPKYPPRAPLDSRAQSAE